MHVRNGWTRIMSLVYADGWINLYLSLYRQTRWFIVRQPVDEWKCGRDPSEIQRYTSSRVNGPRTPARIKVINVSFFVYVCLFGQSCSSIDVNSRHRMLFWDAMRQHRWGQKHRAFSKQIPNLILFIATVLYDTCFETLFVDNLWYVIVLRRDMQRFWINW